MGDSEDVLDTKRSVKEMTALFDKSGIEKTKDSTDASYKKISVQSRVAHFDKKFTSKKSFQRTRQANEESKSAYNVSSDFEHDVQPEQKSKWMSATELSTKNSRSKYGDLRVFREPLCLIRNDENGHLTIDQSVLKEIETIDETVNVIAIAGPCRSGKSYLLNRMAGVKRGFPLGNTTDATTKGIWVWCLKHPERKHEVLMLLDTEGIGDCQKGNEENDNQILCLATLLSGTLVYNIIGVCDNDLLKKLSFITKMSKAIVMSNTIPHLELFGFFFPSLVVCLRDFYLKVSGNMTSDEYFEESLTQTDKKDKMITMEYNEIRSSISDLFRRRKCFIFDRPTGDSEKLQQLEEVEESELCKSFQQQTQQFLKYMYSCKPKEIMDGSLLNGRRVACLTEIYIESLTNGTLLCIDDALTSMSKQENEIAVREAVDMFKQQITALGSPLPDDFELKYKQIQRDALMFFRRRAVLDDENVFHKMAEEEMDLFKVSTMEENKTFLENMCFQELQCMYDKVIKPKVADGLYFKPEGYKQYRADFARLRENVKTSLDGVDANILEMSGIKFEGRYRQQDEEILEKAIKSEFERKVEMKKQDEKNKEEKKKLLEQEEVKKREKAEELNAFKEQLEKEREKSLVELKEKYEKELTEYMEKTAQLEAKLKQKENEALMLVPKPEVKETVIKTMINLVPIIGPIAAGFLERITTNKKK